MPYHALSTPATLEKRTSPESYRRFPDHAYSPLFTTGILNSAHPVEHGRTSQHLTFRQESQSAPRKHHGSSKSGLPSPLSESTMASPSMKKKQSSTSLARSLASSQSGSIQTPRKASAEKDSKGTGKPKSEWWRGRSATVSGKDFVKEDKMMAARTGWLRQSDVWMSEGINTERVANSRTDGLPALPTYRPLPAVSLEKENIPLRQSENPVIKKKSSLGAFRFKNFFQSTKTKESVSRADLQPKVQPFPLSPRILLNQSGQHAVSDDPYSAVHAHSYQSSRRTSSQLHSARSNTRPRPPLITTSVSRCNRYPSPYSAEPAFGPSHDTLPYMTGAGDGWNTPFATRSGVVPSRSVETPGYPFPAVALHPARREPQDQLGVPAEAARHERVPSAAFEYREFETSLRNSGQLSSIHGSGETIAESDKENDTGYLSVRSLPKPKPMSYSVGGKEQSYGTPRQPGTLRAQPSIDSFRRQPLVETVKPLSIGRNYPRSRPFALADTNRQSVRQSDYGKKHAEGYKATRARPNDASDNVPERERDVVDITPEFANLEVESLGDATTDFYDSSRW